MIWTRCARIAFVDTKNPSTQSHPRGTPRARPLFPHRVPLHMLRLAATMVVVVPAIRVDQWEDAWRSWRLVHCMKDHCRNNVGNWPTREVTAPRGARGFDYYSLKDRAMAEAAEYGLMLWDGKSKGTVNNVVNLSRDHKPVVVYVAPTKQFRTIKTFDDLKDLLAQGDSDSVERIVSELHLDVMQQRAAG